MRFSVPAKEFAAADSIGPGLDRSQLGLFRGKPDWCDVELGEELDQIATGFGDESIGEEVTIADHDAESHFSCGRK